MSTTESETVLIAELEAWQTAHGYEPSCALELFNCLTIHGGPKADRAWLLDFCQRWDAAVYGRAK